MNSSRHESIENQRISNYCVHTKQVYSLRDLNPKDELYKKINKHIETCKVCNKEFQLFQVKVAATQVFIPKATIDRDLRESFEREVGELFKVMNLNERERLKKSVKNSLVFADQMGLAFLQNLFSKSMLKAYLVAGTLFIILKVFN